MQSHSHNAMSGKLVNVFLMCVIITDVSANTQFNLFTCKENNFDGMNKSNVDTFLDQCFLSQCSDDYGKFYYCLDIVHNMNNNISLLYNECIITSRDPSSCFEQVKYHIPAVSNNVSCSKTMEIPIREIMYFLNTCNRNDRQKCIDILVVSSFDKMKGIISFYSSAFCKSYSGICRQPRQSITTEKCINNILRLSNFVRDESRAKLLVTALTKTIADRNASYDSLTQNFKKYLRVKNTFENTCNKYPECIKIIATQKTRANFSKYCESLIPSCLAIMGDVLIMNDLNVSEYREYLMEQHSETVVLSVGIPVIQEILTALIIEQRNVVTSGIRGYFIICLTVIVILVIACIVCFIRCASKFK
jgi:hypothetical protein